MVSASRRGVVSPASPSIGSTAQRMGGERLAARGCVSCSCALRPRAARARGLRSSPCETLCELWPIRSASVAHASAGSGCERLGRCAVRPALLRARTVGCGLQVAVDRGAGRCRAGARPVVRARQRRWLGAAAVLGRSCRPPDLRHGVESGLPAGLQGLTPPGLRSRRRRSRLVRGRIALAHHAARARLRLERTRVGGERFAVRGCVSRSCSLRSRAARATASLTTLLMSYVNRGPSARPLTGRRRELLPRAPSIHGPVRNLVYRA